MKRQTHKKRKRYYRKRGATGRKKQKKQHGGFLSRYDLAYVGKDTVNEAAKVAPGVIKQATNDIDQMVKNRLNQAIKTGGAEIEHVLPKILCGAIEDVYKTPYSSLLILGNNNSIKLKRKCYVKILYLYIYYFAINQTTN